MADADDLARFIASHPPFCTYAERWPIQGAMVVRLGLADVLPPPALRSSILAIVFSSDDQVLVVDPDHGPGTITQVLIGGRSQGDETCEQAVIREVGEETGWVIVPLRVVGYRHFHQTEPRVAQSDRPHPDFIQPVYAARAVRFAADLVIPGDLLPVRMLPWVVAEDLVDTDQVALLRAAHDITG